jgi:predicted signal transduction protein with EAL and GGDEF domain
MAVNSWRVVFFAVAGGSCAGLMTIIGITMQNATKTSVPAGFWAFSAILLVLLLGSLWFIFNMFASLRVLRQFAGALGDDLDAPRPRLNVGVVAPLADALDKMRHAVTERQQQALAQSQHCRLTGLSNRLWVELKLPELLQQPGIQLVLVNIKDFKHVNDSFGYHNGDSLLQQLAQQLEQVLK